MSDQKGGTSDVYVNLEQLMFQLSHTRVALQRMSKSVLANFLVKQVTAVTRVFHADTVVDMQHHRSEDNGMKSIESYCANCQKKVTLEKLRKYCKVCKRSLSFHCLRCNTGKLNYKLVNSHLGDRMIFYCSVCGFCSTKSWELQKHTKLVHKKNLVFQCLRCNKTIKNFGGFRSHEKYCGKVANISCALCTRKYKLVNDMQQHVRRMHLKAE